MQLFQGFIDYAFFLLLLALPFPVDSSPEHERRADVCDIEVPDIAETLDGPANAKIPKPAGLGIEFETPHVQFKSGKCTKSADLFYLKGHKVEGHSGKNWDLTVDIASAGGRLNPEYVLNGIQIKIGTGDAAKAGAAAAAGKGDNLKFHPRTITDSAVVM